MRLARVINVGSISFSTSKETRKARLPDAIGKMIQWRYLDLSHTYMDELSSSIGNLRGLQTLKFPQNSPDSPLLLPDEIGNVKQLRHLIGMFQWPFRVNNLRNLRTLDGLFPDFDILFKASFSSLVKCAT